MTLKEIAEELKVSPSTVSRVLNGRSKNFSVKPELRKRILEQIEASGYRPNRVFSSLRNKENSQISFLFYDRNLLRQTNPVSDAVDVISRELPKLNYTFNFIPCESVRNLYYPVPEWKVAGLIVPDVIYPRQLRNIEEAGIPYVVVNGICGKSGSAVMSDEAANMRLVMEHLHALGHRRIGYLDGFVPGNHHHSYNDRKRGYAEFCEEYGLEEFQSEPWKYSPVEAQFDELLKQKITAVVCYNDELAPAGSLLRLAPGRGDSAPAQRGHLQQRSVAELCDSAARRARGAGGGNGRRRRPHDRRKTRKSGRISRLFDPHSGQTRAPRIGGSGPVRLTAGRFSPQFISCKEETG